MSIPDSSALLNHYDITETLLSNNDHKIVLARRISDDTKVILKQSVSQNTDLMKISRLGHEYDILKSLDHPGIPKAYDFLFDGKTASLVMEYIEGQNLKSLLFKSKQPLKHVLNYSIELAGILHYLHECGVIHKDISTGNIMITGDGILKLIDFGISSNFSTENNEMLNVDKIEGTFNYISPEQTGRTVYSVTHSSDFYSFGILLYELLAGKLPFDSVDPLEIIHFHLSRKPLSLSSLISGLPAGLEQVVFKLLEKNPDDRYQTAAGLKTDLELIKKHAENGSSLIEFKAGLRDVTVKYRQTQKLYGREKEIEELTGYYKNLDKMKSMMALVSGYSGVGKSALIRQAKFPIIQQQGTFISGKFDQLKKDIPYFAFIEAIKEFIKNLLSENEDIINAWKHRIISVLGDNAALITDVIPQLSLIIGEQPAVPKLQPAEQESRFNMVLLDFIYAFSTSDNPLVIFLDDLQWADWSSLNLVKRILQNPRDDRVLLLGAYRELEVQQGHPLMITLKQIRESGGTIKTIHLESLDIDTTVQITADSFGMPVTKATELGSHVFSKTKGNPFFIHSFLKTLFNKHLVQYDPIEHWTWNRKEIEALDYTENVIDLMTKGLTSLSETTQKILQHASVLGNTFNLSDLSDITETAEAEVFESLKPAIQERYISAIDLNYRTLSLKSTPNYSDTGSTLYVKNVQFSFTHDRVQQAAYNLIPDIERPYFHLKTGRLLLKSRNQSQLQDDIFEVVNHFVFSATLITDSNEKVTVAELCLNAGRKAKDSNSYSLGVRFLTMGKNLLGDKSWNNQYTLTYNVLIELGECEYLNQNPDLAEACFRELLEHSVTRFEKLKVYYIHSSLYLTIGNSVESLRLGLDAAKLYDITFPSNKNAIQAATALQLAKYLFLFSTKYKNPESLFNLEKCEDEEIITLNKFLIDLATSAYQQDQNLMMLVIFKIIELYIKHGYTDASGWGFSGFSVVVNSALKMQKRGFNLWDVTLKLHQRTESPLIKWRLSYTVLCFHNHWRIPIHNYYDKILDTLKACVLNGDQIFTSYTAALYLRTRINAGVNLKEILDNSDDQITLIRNYQGGYDFFECFYQIAKALHDKTDPGSWDDDKFNGYKTQKRLEAEGNRTKLGFFHTARCTFLYLNEEYPEALKESETVLSYADNFVGDQQQVSQAFYTSLSIAACFRNLNSSDKRKYLRVFKNHLKDMKVWAKGCPENYSQHYHLMHAELFALENDFESAFQSYEKAIRLAAQHRFIHVEGIANERAAQFCLDKGLEKQSRTYIEAAWKAYQKWGAHAKCRKLEKHYPDIYRETDIVLDPVMHKDSTTSTSSKSRLDLASVIKASQSIASQVKYDALLNNLLTITIENAGAERGCLLLEKNNELCIEAIGVSGNDIIEILPSIPLNELKIMPESILYYCWRTDEHVVLDNASTENRFRNDPYLQQNNTLSVMCLPIKALGKSIGLLYLENSLIEGVFNSNRTELMQMLSGQIGISIENSALYINLEEKVKERTKEIEKAYQNLEEAHNNLKAAQEQLIQQEKLASLGQLTAGIAHEIKNPLNFVNNFSELSLELVDEVREEVLSEKSKVKSEKSPFDLPSEASAKGGGGSERSEQGDVEISANDETSSLILEILDDIEANLRKIHEHGTRADSIVKSMLQHTRTGSGIMEPTGLNALVKEYVNLAFHGMRAGKDPINVDIQMELDESIGQVPLIAEDFSRVILNLCNNAFDAMRDKSEKSKVKSIKSPFEGGAGAQAEVGDVSSFSYHPKLIVRTHQTDKSVTIEVQDNGPGIPDDIKDKILQPFFTTKKGTQGTGLGLSITNDIVKAHGGGLKIESEIDKGSTFIIELPVV